MLFEDRLNCAVYRPMGMDWFYNGYWAINNLEDTAKQFLLEDHQDIVDGTPPLNRTSLQENGIYRVMDPGGLSTHRAISLDAFKKLKFDFLIASIPNHIQLFEKLIAEHQPNAKLIVQIGNEWDGNLFAGKNVLASIKRRDMPDGTNAIFYHQEFDLNIFKAQWPRKTNRISSYVNVIQNMKSGWSDFLSLEKELQSSGIEMFSYGGQCRDGNKCGPLELAQSMIDDEFVFHVKDGGDGFGHIIYNAYACGRPVITRKSFYKDRLAEELMNSENTIDLDEMSIPEAAQLIMEVREDEQKMAKMSQSSAMSFYSCVNYREESEAIGNWILDLKKR
jgi:hypothetical protein